MLWFTDVLKVIEGIQKGDNGNGGGREWGRCGKLRGEWKQAGETAVEI